MGTKIRFGDFVREMSIRHHTVSANDLIRATAGPDKKLRVTQKDIYRILAPYTSIRFFEQAKVVIPLAIYIVFFQLVILRQKVVDAFMITGGLFAVMVGLMLFMEGLKLGLMPYAEAIGNKLPVRSPLWLILFIAFLLGVGVTFAEPAIGALKQAGSIVNVEQAPYLYAMLNNYTGVLVLVVGMGVGLAATLGTVRFIYNWSLKPLIYCGVLPTLALTAYISTNPELTKIIGLAWDCGAVTTGPVTVPLVLALGIGVASSAGTGENSLMGFGIVTLASLFPVFGVLCLGVYVANATDPQTIIAAAQQVPPAAAAAMPAWLSSVIGAVRAIVPLVLFLYLVMRIILRDKVSNGGIVFYGIVLTVIGMAVFNIGLEYGLSAIGEQAGSRVPGAFLAVDTMEATPLYFYSVGLLIVVIFALLLGFGATLAEPALNALGLTVQNLTNGAFKKSLLMYSVASGVGIGIAIGVVKLIFDLPLSYILIPGYLFLLVLTALSTEEFVNVGWDSAGVTTGPVTVPLVLAMGLGFGEAVDALEGFGILSMASLCPIISVLGTGLYIGWREKQVPKKDKVLEV